MIRHFTLISPTQTLESAFLRMAKDYADAGETRYAGEAARDGFSFDDYVADLLGHSRGVNLPPGLVPQTTFWMVDEKREAIYGSSRLRHRLTSGSKLEGGHIGYDVPPSHRNRGMATTLLSLTLSKARAIGIYRVLVTCEEDNRASARVIEKNGGVLDNRVVSKYTKKIIKRYWISN